jgi:spermidine synthase
MLARSEGAGSVRPEVSDPAGEQGRPHNGAVGTPAEVTVPPRPASLLMLRSVVFVGGASSLAAEMCASRLLEPYFGTSLFVWANIIGLILVYLSVGYYLGGRIADRFPTARHLYALTAVAAAALIVIPFIARPILLLSLNAFATYSVGSFLGSLLGTILLFAIPTTLLGCVSPFAIRLAVRDVQRAGNVAGSLYALSTVGSIVGTFLSVLVMIPTVGTARTLIVFGLVLLIASVIGLGKPLLWLGVVVGVVLLLLPPAPIKPDPGMIAERESPYNYIQVIQQNGVRELLLNEGVAIHSIYNPAAANDPNPLAHLTRAYWDYVLVAPYYNLSHPIDTIQRTAIIGMGAGTMAKELTYFYGPVPIDGVEIDPDIIQMGRQYFGLDEPNVHAITQDGRYYLRTTPRQFDLISVDAYQTPYIPFQMTTEEFFREVRTHLTPDGSVVINVGRTPADVRLVDVIARTMRAVFPAVYVIDVPAPTNTLILNSLIVANDQPASLDRIGARMQVLRNPVLRALGQQAVQNTTVVQPTSGLIFTDDHAPVEQVVDNMIIHYLRTGQ